METRSLQVSHHNELLPLIQEFNSALPKAVRGLPTICHDSIRGHTYCNIQAFVSSYGSYRLYFQTLQYTVHATYIACLFHINCWQYKEHLSGFFVWEVIFQLGTQNLQITCVRCRKLFFQTPSTHTHRQSYAKHNKHYFVQWS